jgi:hypothetical protein
MKKRQMSIRFLGLFTVLMVIAGWSGGSASQVVRRGICIAGSSDSTACNVIKGFSGNRVMLNAMGATISGGGQPAFPNQVTGDFGTIGGGEGNHAGDRATIAGGSHNSASGFRAAVGGGSENGAQGEHSTVSGGTNNTASATRATVGGGCSNTASHLDATVSGGSGNTASFSHATVGGGTNNIASSLDSTVGGGSSNTASGAYGTIGGGSNNDAAGFGATVGGGSGNRVSAGNGTVSGGLGNRVTDNYSTVSGGLGNEAGNANDDLKDAQYSTVGGGLDNIASGLGSTVGGGANNRASGSFSIVPGGSSTVAGGNYTFAAGRRAHIDATHNGTFLYADSKDFDFTSIATNEFAVRATGGVRFVTAIDISGNPHAGVRLVEGSSSWDSLSDRNAKTNFAQVDGREILDRLVKVPINTWNYKNQTPSIRHIGPTAQDFNAAFTIGKDDKYISMADADGVALAAIQGLWKIVNEKDDQITAMEAQNDTQKKRIAVLEARVASLEQKAILNRTQTHSLSDNLTGNWSLFAGLCLLSFVLGQRRGHEV